MHVVIGQPLDLRDVTCRCNREGEDQRQVWRDITQRVQAALAALEEVAPPNVDQVVGGRQAHRDEAERRDESALPA